MVSSETMFLTKDSVHVFDKACENNITGFVGFPACIVGLVVSLHSQELLPHDKSPVPVCLLPTGLFSGEGGPVYLPRDFLQRYSF